VNLLWTRRALRNLDNIKATIAADNPRAAIRVADRIAQALNRLRDFPESGRPGRVPETREVVVPTTPYIVAYRIHGETVQILRVIHGARKWPERL
jgi:toxin ParE1/3/4